VLLSAAILTCGALALFYLSERSTAQALDSVTMCPQDGPEGLTVLVIDRTDDLTPIQRASLKNHFDDSVREVPQHGAVELFSVERVGPQLLQRAGLRLCNPGRSASRWTGNPVQVEKRWQEHFLQPLERLEDEVVGGLPASQSPILESLQSVATTDLQAPDMRRKPRKLIIASDMLQNTNGMSQYRQVVPFADFRRTRYFQQIRTDWSGVEIEIFYLTRPGTPQGRTHIEFWQQYFTAGGGTLTRVTSL